MNRRTPLLLIDAAGIDPAIEIERLSFSPTGDNGGYDEAFIQRLIFANPSALPVAEIDSAYKGLLPVCMELNTPAGPVDALFVNADGMIALAEFKLWRNPQARREVIGQILDYAKELAKWDYSDIQREVSRATRKSGNVMFELTHADGSALDEAEFIDSVTRNLQKGRFLLLVVGDGIREGVESIIEFLQEYTGLQFTIALVEVAIHQLADKKLLVHPRTLAKTTVIGRIEVDLKSPEIEVAEAGPSSDRDQPSPSEEQNQTFWRAVLSQIEFDDPDQRVPKPSTVASKWFMLGFTSKVWVTCSLERGRSEVLIYVSHDSTDSFGRSFFEILGSDIENLKSQVGDDLTAWKNSNGQARFGFRRTSKFLVGESDGLDSDAKWAREKLNLLIGTVRPLAQKSLAEFQD